MLKFVVVGFLIIFIGCAPTFMVSESIALTRAIENQNTYKELPDFLIPGFLARARFDLFGVRACKSALEGVNEPHNLVNFLVAAHSYETNNKVQIQSYLTLLKEKGCSLDSVDTGGLPAIHSAVLYNDHAMTKFLVENGASLDSKIERPNKKSHKKNALEFAYLLKEVEPEVNRDKIIGYLNNIGR